MKTNPLERKFLGADELSGVRLKVYEVIFEAETPLGKAFDVALIVAILGSVVAVMLESVAGIRAEYGDLLYMVEWVLTILFSIEYLLRLTCVGKPLRYARSFFGMVDLLAVIPTYVSLFLPGAQFLLVIRLLRVLRVFRVLKLVHYMSEADVLIDAMRASRRKILIFMAAVLTLVVILGSLMYMIEGPPNGFTSIPRSVYWAIVTLTTVGYGDISPQTAPGQSLASFIMIMGYAILAVPTGIVTSELTRARLTEERIQRAELCQTCGATDHDSDARFCKMCGTGLAVVSPGG